MLMKATPTPKTRRCKVCRGEFVPFRMGCVCSADCAKALVDRKKAKEAARQEREVRRVTREMRESLKPRKQLISEAQTAVNRYARLRDFGKPCICCGKPFEPDRIGGSVDAGHYLSVGSAPHLRFDLRNISAQRKSCNRPGGTTRERFRAGMVARWGLSVVEALEADQTLRKWSPDYLRRLKRVMNKKANRQEKRNAKAKELTI